MIVERSEHQWIRESCVQNVARMSHKLPHTQYSNSAVNESMCRNPAFRPSPATHSGTHVVDVLYLVALDVNNIIFQQESRKCCTKSMCPLFERAGVPLSAK